MTPKPEPNGGVPNLGDARNERSFDDLTRALASSTVSRGRVLRVMGGALVGAVVASIPGVAWAKQNNPKKCNPEDEGKLCAGDCGVCLEGTCFASTERCGPGQVDPAGKKREVTDPNNCTYCDRKTFTCTSPTKCAPCELCSTNQGCAKFPIETYCSYIGNPAAPSGFKRTCDPATGLCSCDPETEVRCKSICVTKCTPPEKLDETTCSCKPECNVNEECDTENCEVCDKGFCTKACPAEECCGAAGCCSSPLTCCPAGLGQQIRCVNLNTAHNDCGQCDNGCPLGDSGQIVNTCCGGQCVNLQTDKDNCGSCNNACPTAETCEGGTCKCPQGLTACGGKCVDTNTDRFNCGSCDKDCEKDYLPGFVCIDGQCQCPEGLTACPDHRTNYSTLMCTDIKKDMWNCGGCGKLCPGGQYMSCINGGCTCTGKWCGCVCCGPNDICMSDGLNYTCCSPGQIGCGSVQCP